jgi:hypothetical protein
LRSIPGETVTGPAYDGRSSIPDVETSKIDANADVVPRPDPGPIPDAFGKPNVEWHPSAGHDPVEVAALHLQHLLIMAARRAWSRLSPSAAFTGSTLATLMDTPDSLRPAEKRLAGQQFLQLEDIVRLGLLLGDDVLAAVPRSTVELLPEPYQQLVDRWEPGAGVLPRFRPAGPGGHDWTHAAGLFAHFLNTEVAAGRDHLLTTDAVAYAFIRSLTESGTDASQIELADDQSTEAAIRTLLITSAADTVLASLAYLPDRADAPRALGRRIIDILYNAADGDAEHRVVVIVSGPAATRQLRTHLPDAFSRPPGTEFTFRVQTAARTQPAAANPALGPDLDLLLLDRQHPRANEALLALSVTKRR